VAAPDLPVPAGLDRLVAVWAYDGVGRDLVSGLKYGRCRGAATRVALAMASLAPADVDLVTWAPTSTQRRRSRGFDPAEVLARPVARRLRRPVRAVLRRTSASAQTGRDLAARQGDPPRFEPVARVEGRVLLVDDVLTSGATLAAAAAVLRAAGAAEVVGLVAARRP
jgi:predicted amidophosphoribosyltransferase